MTTNLYVTQQIIHSKGHYLVQFVVEQKVMIGEDLWAVCQDMRLCVDLVEAIAEQALKVGTLEIGHPE